MRRDAAGILRRAPEDRLALGAYFCISRWHGRLTVGSIKGLDPLLP